MNAMKVHAPVLAVDVGYGNTKVAFRNGSDVSTFMFPSLTPPYKAHTIAKESAGLITTPKTIAVEVEGKRYQVGPGVLLSSRNGDAGATLNDDYCTTSSYAALLAGAFHFANIASVDRLVLGLPMRNFHTHVAHLRSAFAGKNAYGEVDFDVGSVIVLPQPLGALVNFSRYHEFDKEDPHLIIDVGYFTTDWVVATGLTIDEERSGGHHSGASHYYEAIAAVIKEKLHIDTQGIERIDKALRTGSTLLLNGNDYYLREFLPGAQTVIDAAVKAIQAGVKNTVDIRSIVLTGGGAALYKSEIQARFPHLRIDHMADPCFTNVKGFLAAGEATLLRDKKRKEGVPA